MKVTQKKVGDGRLQLDAVADAAEVNDALFKAATVFAQKMGLRRQGKETLYEAAEKQMGIKDLDSVVENEAIEILVPYALDKRGITPSIPPQPLSSAPMKRDKPFSFRLFVMPKPDYELSSYEPVEITVQRFVPDFSKVDKDLADMADRYAEFIGTGKDGVVEKGTNVKIAIDAYKDGVKVEGLSTDGRTYTAGEGYMPEGFENEVLGMAVGETKEFSFDGPGFDDDYNEITEHIDCKVTILEIQEKRSAEITDEWISKYMPMYKSVADMRADMEKNYERQQRDMYDNYVRNMASNEIAKRFTGKIPDPVYEAASKNWMQTMRQQVAAQHMTWEQFMEQQGGEQQFQMMAMMQVRSGLVSGYALDAVFRHEGLVLSPQDVDECCYQMNPQNPRAVRRELEENGKNFVLRESAERYKAAKYLVEHAKITYAQEDSAEEAGEPEAE